jgi:transcriptional regulator with XRE-family HTH domain
MSAVVLSAVERDEAARVSREIGRAFAAARRAVGVSQDQVARDFNLRRDNVGRFELGYQPNVKLGTVVRFLGAYGLTLKVVANDQAATDGSTIPPAVLDRERDAARWRWIRRFLTPFWYGRTRTRADLDLDMPIVEGLPVGATVEQIADFARRPMTRIPARGAA